MSRDEIKDFLIEVKSFYPRFSLVDVDENDDYVVRTQTLDAWYDMIGYKSHEDCRKILKEYIAGPNGDKTPGVKVFTSGSWQGGPSCTAWIYNGQIHWRPGPGAEAVTFGAFWNGTAWQDKDGRLWAAPEGGQYD